MSGDLSPNSRPKSASQQQAPLAALHTDNTGDIDLRTESLPTASATTLSQPEHNSSSNQLSVEEIDKTMKSRGFAEMRLLWKSFLRRDKNLEKADNSWLERAIERHSKPLFGHPILVTSALAVGSLFAANAVMYGVAKTAGLGPIAASAVVGIAAVNYTALTAYALCCLQRYLCAPLGKIMRRDLAYMLSQKDYRSIFEGQQRTQETNKKLSELGINTSWDNPAYKKDYVTVDGQIQEVIPLTEEQYIQSSLRDFLGRKNQETRKFEPGRYTSCLRSGKKR